MSESPTSIVPHDWIPLVYADRHGNLKLSQAALEIARQLSPPIELPNQSPIGGYDPSQPVSEIKNFTTTYLPKDPI